MDPFSQGLLGASLAASLAKKQNIKVSALAGGVGGVSPDLDIFIRSNTDPLLFIEYHRHFTHSLAFVPFGGLIVSSFLFFFLKKHISFGSLYFYSTVGFFTHGLLDACTSYGTTLFWPFSDKRVSWNIISVVDPIFTLILLVFLTFCLLKKSLIQIKFGLFLSSIYLFLGFVKYQMVESFIYDTASQRNHKIQRILLNPTIGNNILWRSVYQFENNYYIDAVHMTFLGEPKLKKGAIIKVINQETIFPDLARNSIQRNDIRRFSNFSQNFIYLHPDYDDLLADLRYGTLPHDYKSLWGIKINKSNNNHVEFKNLRDFEKRDYKEFWKMLKGIF